MNFVTAKEVKEKLHISGVTLMRWKNESRIKSMTLSTRKVLYDLDSIIKEDENKKENKLNVIYGRVSTPRQKTDLNNQIELIK